ESYGLTTADPSGILPKVCGGGWRQPCRQIFPAPVSVPGPGNSVGEVPRRPDGERREGEREVPITSSPRNNSEFSCRLSLSRWPRPQVSFKLRFRRRPSISHIVFRATQFLFLT